MAQKHLHELLKEDQEPFYTTNKRFQLKRLNFSSPKNSSLQIKKIQKPINQTPTSKFCKNTCFFSYNDSPDLRKLPSRATKKTPENGKFVLHVPAGTATLLLEAAMRIQKQQNSSSKPKIQIKKLKFGGFGSILKRLKDRNSNKKDEIKSGENSFSCSCNNSRVNSEINEEKFMDLDNYRNSDDCGSCPSSPYRFSLQRCPSSGDVMPEFTTPAASPVRHMKEDKENYETIISLASIDKVEEEEEEKEQCSPVSVLDPPFEEEYDDTGHEDRVEDEDEDEDSNLDCSYALVQRAQQQLLYKLCRFEKLAELDPIELEKLLLQEEEEEEEEDNDDHVEEHENQVSNLIFEEKSEVKSLNYGEAVFGRESKRSLDSSRELRSSTIDMMVKSGFKIEFDEWNEFQEQREETAKEFAFSIFGLLVEELGEELIH